MSYNIEVGEDGAAAAETTSTTTIIISSFSHAAVAWCEISQYNKCVILA
jgi:hypothetical protein